MAAIGAAEAISDAVWRARHRLGPHRDVLTPVVSVVAAVAVAVAVAVSVVVAVAVAAAVVPVLFHRG